MNEPVTPSKIDPTEIGAFCIYALMWLVATFELVNMQRLGLSHGDAIYYFPLLLFICSIFYVIYLAMHSFWRIGNKVFYRWLLAIAVSPLLIIIIMVISEF